MKQLTVKKSPQRLHYILVASGLASLLFISTATANAATATNSPNAPPPSLTARSPSEIYRVTCGYCHGRNVGPIILGRKIEQETIKTIVRNGHNAMPSFRQSEISPAELEALANWITASQASSQEFGK